MAGTLLPYPGHRFTLSPMANFQEIGPVLQIYKVHSFDQHILHIPIP